MSRGRWKGSVGVCLWRPCLPLLLVRHEGLQKQQEQQEAQAQEERHRAVANVVGVGEGQWPLQRE